MKNPFTHSFFVLMVWSLFCGTTYEVKENQNKVGELIVNDGQTTSKPLEVSTPRPIVPIDYPVKDYRQILVTKIDKIPVLSAPIAPKLNVYSEMPRAQAEKNLLGTTSAYRFKKYTEAVSIPRLSSAEGPPLVNTVVYDYRYNTPTERHVEKVYFHNDKVLKTQHQVEPR